MAIKENIKFSFTSTAHPDDTFMVAEFNGKEAISKLYKFEIVVYSDDPDIDLKEVLKNPVKLTVEKDGEELRVFHGILSRFEQLHEYSGHVYFRAILVPRLWIADQYLENQLFLDKNVPDIIEEVLKQSGLTSNDYELKLTGSYDPWEYICQYNESDFNFICRWMEREGIFYYFEQGDDAEKLIIADASTAHEDIPSGESIRYSPPDSLTPSTMEQVREFTCHQQLLPQKVVLKDYNYRKPSLSLKGEADIDPDGRGNVYIYGEHFKTPEQGNALATIRAEELLCREALFYGEGTVPPFLTGYIFELHDHYRDSYNQRYLITELSHEGVQSTYLSGAGGDSSDTETQGPSYLNNFSCIPADTQFRPERLAKKPKLNGSINAHVDAGGDGKYAEIDDDGRYKVKLPFDQNNSPDGKASRWVRMAQPYAGDDYGMHFPLHKGTEVMLTFIDGDPDRPIITGAIPNPQTMSPVVGANQTQSVMHTAGGNKTVIEDTDGKQFIHTTQTCGNEFKMDGTSGGEKIELRDKYGNEVVLDAVAGTLRLYSPTHKSEIVLGKSIRQSTLSDLHTTIFGHQKTEIVKDVVKVTHGTTSNTHIGIKNVNNIGATYSTNAAIVHTANLSYSYNRSYSKEDHINFSTQGKNKRVKGPVENNSDTSYTNYGGTKDKAKMFLSDHYSSISYSSRNKLQIYDNGWVLLCSKQNKINIEAKKDLFLTSNKSIILNAGSKIKFKSALTHNNFKVLK